MTHGIDCYYWTDPVESQYWAWRTILDPLVAAVFYYTNNIAWTDTMANDWPVDLLVLCDELVVIVGPETIASPGPQTLVITDWTLCIITDPFNYRPQYGNCVVVDWQLDPGLRPLCSWLLDWPGQCQLDPDPLCAPFPGPEPTLHCRLLITIPHCRTDPDHLTPDLTDITVAQRTLWPQPTAQANDPGQPDLIYCGPDHWRILWDWTLDWKTGPTAL